MLSSALSTCSIVCVAIRLKRIKVSCDGTAGDTTGFTNMPSSSIRALVNKQLDDNIKWDFQKSFLKGEGVIQTGGYSMPKTRLWYCIPDEESIKLNSKYINAMCDGKKIDTEKKIFDVEKAEKEAKKNAKENN